MKNTNQNHTETLVCPECGREIALDKAIAHRIEDGITDRLVALKEAKDRELATKLREKDEQNEDKLAAERERSEQLRNLLAEHREQEAARVKQELEAQRASMAQQLANQFHEENRLKLADKDNLIADLQVEKRRIETEVRLALTDKDSVITTLRADFEKMKQRMEQGSIQRQGESLEVVFESQLAQAFPCDLISPVGKGKPGADNVHYVCATDGTKCGTILWETKRHQSWSNDWVTKLKTDQRTANTDAAVIVCTPSCMPKGLHGFGHYHGVLVCEHSYAISLAAILRERLAAEAQIRAQQANGSEEKDQLHALVCSDFHQQVVAVVELSIVAQLDQLAKEKVSTQNKWASRERQINAAMASIAKLYGGIQSIVGTGTLPNLPTLMLEAKASPRLL
jgi:hypothetical protein